MDMRELYWAAGFIEGEGCFTFSKDLRGRSFVSVRLVVSQRNREPLERLSRLFGDARWYICKSDVVNWTLYGNRAVAVMMTLWPLMSETRRAQIEKAIAAWKQNVPRSELEKYKTRERGKFVVCNTAA